MHANVAHCTYFSPFSTTALHSIKTYRYYNSYNGICNPLC